MELKSIETEQEYDILMAWVDKQFDQKTPPNSPDGRTLQTALLLVKTYEDEHYPVTD